jgi:pimeloyl-ACP methyl ester carboxylesterase
MHGLVCTSGDPHGRLPPIVLVHGLGVSTLYLLPTMRKLAARYRVYAPDLPGFGRSAKPRRTMDMESLADALLGWLKARGVGPAVFVCNSMGCQVAVALAVRHPDLVTRLILSGPTMDPHAGSPFIQVLRLLRDALHEKPSLWFVAGFDYVRAWPLRVLKSLRLAIADHVERRLPAVAAPTLVVRGSLDPVAPRQWVREMVDLLPSAEFAEIEGTGHAVNYSTPDQFTALIQSFPRSR